MLVCSTNSGWPFFLLNCFTFKKCSNKDGAWKKSLWWKCSHTHTHTHTLCHLWGKRSGSAAPYRLHSHSVLRNSVCFMATHRSRHSVTWSRFERPHTPLVWAAWFKNRKCFFTIWPYEETNTHTLHVSSYKNVNKSKIISLFFFFLQTFHRNL